MHWNNIKVIGTAGGPFAGLEGEASFWPLTDTQKCVNVLWQSGQIITAYAGQIYAPDEDKQLARREAARAHYATIRKWTKHDLVLRHRMNGGAMQTYEYMKWSKDELVNAVMEDEYGDR